jgi:hypothetical protein
MVQDFVSCRPNITIQHPGVWREKEREGNRQSQSKQKSLHFLFFRIIFIISYLGNHHLLTIALSSYKIFWILICRLKMATFWAAAPCSLVEVYRRFRGACCLQYQGDYRPVYGASTHIWNVGKLPPDYMAQHPRRQSPSYSPLKSHVYQIVVSSRTQG